MATVENEPAQNPNPPPNWRKSVLRVIVAILGVLVIVLALSTVPGSTLRLPPLPVRWIVLAIIAVIVVIGWRWRAQKSPSLPKPSPKHTGPRARPICGGISLACALAGVSCIIASYTIGNSFTFLGVSLLLILPTLCFSILGLALREHPKWPAAVGGLIGASPLILFILVAIYSAALRPVVERVQQAYLHDAEAPSKPSSLEAGRGTSRADRAQWCAEAQAAVESWLRSDTNNLFTPEYGKFVSLEGTGFSSPLWNIQGYDYITLHRTGHFTDGTIPVKIYVTEGAVTAPGKTTLGTPTCAGPVRFQGAEIFISHPNVGRGVGMQSKANVTARQQTQKTFDSIIKRRQFEQAVERWGDEGMTAIEALLKNGTNGISALCGEFVCFQNEGYPKYSLLATQDSAGNREHSQIHVRVRALFSLGYLPLEIRITEGRVTAPELSTIGMPAIQGRIDLHSGATLVVAHPQLCSLEDFQGQDSLAFVAADGESKLVGTYTLGSGRSAAGNASTPPCALELRADHTFTVSNLPTAGDPQQRASIPGQWSLSTNPDFEPPKIVFRLSVSGGDAVKVVFATCNLTYPPGPSAFRPTVTLTLQETSGARQHLEFVADRVISSLPRKSSIFVTRNPTNNPPNWNTPVYNNPELRLRPARNG